MIDTDWIESYTRGAHAQWMARHFAVDNGKVEYWFDGLVHALSYNPTQGDRIAVHLLDAISRYGKERERARAEGAEV